MPSSPLPGEPLSPAQPTPSFLQVQLGVTGTRDGSLQLLQRGTPSQWDLTPPGTQGDPGATSAELGVRAREECRRPEKLAPLPTTPSATAGEGQSSCQPRRVPEGGMLRPCQSDTLDAVSSLKAETLAPASWLHAA